MCSYYCYYIGGIREWRGGEYMLDGYITLRNPKTFNNNGVEYSLQYYQKKHKNEYVIKSKKGDCCLYKNGLLKMIWKEDDDGNRMGEFVSFDKGRISFIQNFANLLNGNEWIRIINDKRGECMEIWKEDKVVYRGEFNDLHEREGIGIMFDASTSKELLEGVFKNNELVGILKIFEGDEMIELYDNGNSMDVSKQIPIYIGGYVLDENDGEYKRNGLGYLIDEIKRIATRECIYEKGIEVSGRNLFDGWYQQGNHPFQVPDYPMSIPLNDIHVSICNEKQLNKMNMNVTSLTIGSNSCNELNSLNLNLYKRLKSIEIGDNCFMNVDRFVINELNNLKLLKIGINSFTKKTDSYGYDSSRSFHLLNCRELEAVEIGRYSFSDYSGAFEVKNLPSLAILYIGSKETDFSEENNHGFSVNFVMSPQFVLKGVMTLYC